MRLTCLHVLESSLWNVASYVSVYECMYAYACMCACSYIPLYYQLLLSHDHDHFYLEAFYRGIILARKAAGEAAQIQDSVCMDLLITG